ncbi:MAG TPA: hypothetical protein PKV71_18035 [Calditrichia bacterium]|nr:hypothetical protein [Calditrichota bacterium]HQV33791.1 hypothetical protein [Calditrichia bacterium]
MIAHLRKQFNADFQESQYQAIKDDINRDLDNSLVFRLSETPLFLDDDLTRRLIRAAYDVIEVVQHPEFHRQTVTAVPDQFSVANESPHPHFVQVDFAVCRDEQGQFLPQLIEVQGFPSLYAFQHYLDGKLRQHFPIPENFTPFFSGLLPDTYQAILGRILLGDSAPENVILLEYQPQKQKTRIDFQLVERYYGIKAVCVTEVFQKGNRLYYRDAGRDIPVERIYHRFIFDELLRANAECNFNLKDGDLQVQWVGHPNWFFRLSKHTLPLIKSPYCPECHYLSELIEYPEDLSNYVLKPLYSFAGQGVQVDFDAATLDAIADPENYILQRKVTYTPLIETPDEPAKAEIRMMFIWEDGQEPLLVNNLLRLSKGRMMGVDFNRNRTWVGSSLAFHRLDEAF